MSELEQDLELMMVSRGYLSKGRIDNRTFFVRANQGQGYFINVESEQNPMHVNGGLWKYSGDPVQERPLDAEDVVILEGLEHQFNVVLPGDSGDRSNRMTLCGAVVAFMDVLVSGSEKKDE